MTVKTEDAKRMEPLVSRECESCGRSMIRVVDDNKIWWECYSVKCESCRRFTKKERSGRTLMVCSVDRAKPALVGDLWRRCRDYVARMTG